MHELAPRYETEVRGSSDRSFGLVFFAFFLILGLLPLLKGESVRIWAILAGSASAFLAVFAPRALAPANRLWTRFGSLLHGIVSPVALGIVFYAVVTPVGLLMRAFGKDSLHLRKMPQAETYWIRRDSTGPAADSFNNQF